VILNQENYKSLFLPVRCTPVVLCNYVTKYLSRFVKLCQPKKRYPLLYLKTLDIEDLLYNAVAKDRPLYQRFTVDCLGNEIQSLSDQIRKDKKENKFLLNSDFLLNQYFPVENRLVKFLKGLVNKLPFAQVIAAMMVYSHNSYCTQPLHIPLSHALWTWKSRKNLLALFNKIGICTRFILFTNCNQ